MAIFDVFEATLKSFTLLSQQIQINVKTLTHDRDNVQLLYEQVRGFIKTHSLASISSNSKRYFYGKNIREINKRFIWRMRYRAQIIVLLTLPSLFSAVVPNTPCV